MDGVGREIHRIRVESVVIVCVGGGDDRYMCKGATAVNHNLASATFPHVH